MDKITLMATEKDFFDDVAKIAMKELLNGFMHDSDIRVAMTDIGKEDNISISDFIAARAFQQAESMIKLRRKLLR